MNSKVKNILIVTHQFVPHQSPRTTRWKLIYDELVKKGFNIRVITGTRQDGTDSNIQYIGNKTASGVVSSLRKQSNTDQGSFYKNQALKFLKKIYRFFYKFFAWPDYTMFWVFSIWKNRKKIDFDYDAIISVSLPFSSHVAAYIINKVKRKKWIMDIGDPFSLKSNAFENNKYFYKSLNYYFENKFFKMADQIVFTHKDASLEHKEFFDISDEKIEIGKGRIIQEGKKIALINFGARLNECKIAAQNLEKKGLSITIIDARFCKPLDENLMWQVARNHEILISIEEGSIGGFGSHLSKFLSDKSLLEKIKFRSMILPDRFIEHNDPKKMYEEAGLDSQAIENKIYEIIDSKILAQKQN